ncbi:MAG: VF530 family protein [Mariprofundus sp.]|nr:VF530 family protein [Mariprofundus sp.]
MKQTQANNPLHGITLEMMLKELVEHYGWGELGIHVRIKCFNNDPSVKSSLTFLRRNPWARTKVENLYLDMLNEKQRAQASPWPGRK